MGIYPEASTGFRSVAPEGTACKDKRLRACTSYPSGTLRRQTRRSWRTVASMALAEDIAQDWELQRYVELEKVIQLNYKIPLTRQYSDISAYDITSGVHTNAHEDAFSAP